MAGLLDLSAEIRQAIFELALAARPQDPPATNFFKTVYEHNSEQAQLTHKTGLSIVQTCKVFRREMMYPLNQHISWLDHEIWMLWGSIGSAEVSSRAIRAQTQTQADADADEPNEPRYPGSARRVSCSAGHRVRLAR